MNTHPMKLVTSVCEAYGLDPAKTLLREVGAHGWTHFAVEGAGAGGERAGEMKEFANVQIEVVLPPGAAGELLARLQKEFFPRYGMIAFESDVRVVRAGKFTDGMLDCGRIVKVIPRDVKLEDLTYAISPERRLVVTDGREFSLDINEFGLER